MNGVLLAVVILFIFIVAVVVIIGAYLITVYNKLIGLRNNVRNQRSQIDVQLKMRFDMIPNLVETVKGYAKHERATLEEVISARNSYVSAAGNTAAALQADNALTGALTKLFALSESYPELKANTIFTALQSNLQEMEKKIAFSRQFYNDAVNIFNNKVEMFPSNIVANMAKFEKEAFYEAKDEERENVRVSFSE